ncbi:SurA domain protein [Desulfarculus baarsii DSM 2075]|uniref:SurA domain protein n=1 Tax=Desulfarculus baarsii (strain ATCC 33931 / DSM 2075 / LMG 7858 / VKM B-1802 / 2st14) TaxID=644282 RepID=E1QHF2_DESB2|nr:SurA N-terminal domain-containing protein [Desulfarculus baarsii]ADK84995.1 SurA domain protein [Desulfarculus baarsii DSM 2075]
MRLRSVIAGLAFVTMAFAPLAVLAEELVNRVVAVVGDEPITAAELDRSIQGLLQRLQMMQQQQGQNMAMPPAAEVRYMALNSLIDEKLFNKEVERLKISVSEEEVSMFLERLKAANNMTQQEFIARLNETGMTPEEYREKVRNDQLKRKLINYEVKNKVVISDKEVDDYLAEHPELVQGGGPQLTIQALFLKLPENAGDDVKAQLRAKAEALREEAVDGADFDEMCRANSQGPGAASGGKIGPLSKSDLLPEMGKALETMKEGDMSPVLDIPSGVVFMRLISLTDGKEGSAEVRDQVRARLENNQLEERFGEWMKELRAKTYIQIIE